MRKSFLFLLVFAGMFLAGCSFQQENRYQLINANDVGPILIDGQTGKMWGLNNSDRTHDVAYFKEILREDRK